MTEVKVQLRCETRPFDAALLELRGIAETLPKVVDSFLGDGDIFRKLFRFNAQVATGTADIWFALKPTDFYFGLVAALRAVKADREIIQRG